jgi:hypothetical protein
MELGESVRATEVGFEVKEKLARLRDALITNHPSMPVLLRDIHDTSRRDESITLLSEEEINVIVSGLKRQTAAEIVMASMSKKGKSKEAKKPIGDSYADEL